MFTQKVGGREQDHAVVVGCGPHSWGRDPSIQLIAWGEDGKKLWDITVQVARLTVGPKSRSGSPIYNPTVLLVQLRDQTTGRFNQKLGVFPIERLMEIIPVDADDCDLRSQYTHLFNCSREQLHIHWNCVVAFMHTLGKEVGSATCRVQGREFFAEGGEWADDMSKPISILPVPVV